MKRLLTLAILLILSIAGHAAAQTYTCVRTGQATTSTAPGILDLKCTEEVTNSADYDFRVAATRSSSSYAWFSVVALSRPFGSVVIDARVECDDGTFYMSPDSISSTDPLAVGEAGGDVAVDLGDCSNTYTKITLTPRFPEWRCDGCGEYVPSP